MVSASVRRQQIAFVCQRGRSVRQACALLRVARSTVGYESKLSRRDAPAVAVMKELARSGMTMIVVTHELGFAREVADRIVYMDQGAIVEQGPPAQLLSDPQSDRLQAFLRRYREAYLL